MVAIENLQKIQTEADSHLAQLISASSRVYEITVDGAIVERTHQLRDFYGFLQRQIAHLITLLSLRGRDD
jgi:hypothetical protein